MLWIFLIFIFDYSQGNFGIVDIGGQFKTQAECLDQLNKYAGGKGFSAACVEVKKPYPSNR